MAKKNKEVNSSRVSIPVMKKNTEKKSRSGAVFRERVETIQKKVWELSTLCGVRAVAVIVGPDGKIQSFPGDRQEFLDVYNRYQQFETSKKSQEKVGLHTTLPLSVESEVRVSDFGIEWELPSSSPVIEQELDVAAEEQVDLDYGEGSGEEIDEEEILGFLNLDSVEAPQLEEWL